MAVGWSIGATLLGRYYDPVKQLLYVERSFWVEMLNLRVRRGRAQPIKLRQAQLGDIANTDTYEG